MNLSPIESVVPKLGSQAFFLRSFPQRIFSCSPLALPVAQIGFRTFATLHEKYLHSGCWSEKESLRDYLKEREVGVKDYLKQLERSPKEEELFHKVKMAYENRTGSENRNTYPHRVTLETHTKTYENSGDHYLSRKEIEFYIEHGLIGPVPLPTLSERTLQAIMKRFSGIPDTLTPQQYRDARVRQEWQSKDILQVACSEEIVAKVTSLLGDNVKVRFTAIHEIAPHAGSFSSLTEDKIPELCAHSDTNLGLRLNKRELEGPIVGLDSINVWISINGTNADNGPLYMFPKTHNWSVLTPMKYLEHARNDPSALEQTLKLLSISGFGNEMIANHALSFNYLQTSAYRHQLSKIKRVEIYTKPAEALIFSTHLLHGSDVNRTSQTRLAISVRYSRATTQENDDNLKAVNALFSKSERARLGLSEADGRNPIIQVAGTKHHEKSKPVNLDQLHKILDERAKG